MALEDTSVSRELSRKHGAVIVWLCFVATLMICTLWTRRILGTQPHVRLGQAVKNHMSHAGVATRDAHGRLLNTETGRPILNEIFYLHVPKCGSSFATLILQYACPEIPKNISVREPGGIEYPPGQALDRQRYCGDVFRRFDSGHYPLPKARATKHTKDVFSSEGHDVVTFLRDPTERFMSALLDGFHSCNMSSFAAVHPWLYPHVKNPANVMGAQPNYTHLFDVAPRDVLVDIVTYYWTCVEGCATRMILGDWCGDTPSTHNEKPTMAKVRHALERLDRFAFIGLTGRWNESVHLWRDMFGGTYSDLVYENVRPSDHQQYTHTLLDIIEEQGLVDDADTILYRFAESRMNALLL